MGVNHSVLVMCNGHLAVTWNEGKQKEWSHAFIHFSFFNFMFKKIFLALVCLTFALSGSAAIVTAILQSGEKITPFYGENAFVEAYEAAVNGDVITLSAGFFKGTDIKKSITVVGAGAWGGASTDIRAYTYSNNSYHNMSVTADNVTLEGIYFRGDKIDNLEIRGTNNLTIKRCYISYLFNKIGARQDYHNNTVLIDCSVTDCHAMSKAQNMTFRNCSIGEFSGFMNDTNKPALIENCNISIFNLRVENGKRESGAPSAIYRNCFLGLYNYDSDRSSWKPSLDFSSTCEFYNNCFCENYVSADDKSWNLSLDVERNNIVYRPGSPTSSGSYWPRKGSFSAHVQDSISYGPINHKSNPAIPSIVSSEIDSQTDTEGNLHVKIAAKAND